MNTSALIQEVWSFCHTLRDTKIPEAALSGQLVPQDPADEPASVLQGPPPLQPRDESTRCTRKRRYRFVESKRVVHFPELSLAPGLADSNPAESMDC